MSVRTLLTTGGRRGWGRGGPEGVLDVDIDTEIKRTPVETSGVSRGISGRELRDESCGQLRNDILNSGTGGGDGEHDHSKRTPAGSHGAEPRTEGERTAGEGVVEACGGCARSLVVGDGKEDGGCSCRHCGYRSRDTRRTRQRTGNGVPDPGHSRSSHESRPGTDPSIAVPSGTTPCPTTKWSPRGSDLKKETPRSHPRS